MAVAMRPSGSVAWVTPSNSRTMIAHSFRVESNSLATHGLGYGIRTRAEREGAERATYIEAAATLPQRRWTTLRSVFASWSMSAGPAGQLASRAASMCCPGFVESCHTPGETPVRYVRKKERRMEEAPFSPLLLEFYRTRTPSIQWLVDVLDSVQVRID
jgi:hypothetical protein